MTEAERQLKIQEKVSTSKGLCDLYLTPTRLLLSKVNITEQNAVLQRIIKNAEELEKTIKKGKK